VPGCLILVEKSGKSQSCVTGLIGRGIAQEMSTGSEDDEVTTGISAGDADAFSVYKILDGETKLNYRAEQGYIYPCK